MADSLRELYRTNPEKLKGLDSAEVSRVLDEDLNRFVAEKMEKNKDYKYEDKEGWENHPAFMTEDPTQEQIDSNPYLQALQAIKYEKDDPKEYASSMKDDGNYYFKRKEYQHARIAYGEGLLQIHDDMTLKAVLFTNRAASQYHLKNYRSSLNDARMALKCKPDHMKAFHRCATCCIDMERFDESVHWCDQALLVDNKDQKILELRKQAITGKKKKERDERQREARERKHEAVMAAQAEALRKRNITLQWKGKQYSGNMPQYDSIIPLVVQSTEGKMHLDENNTMHWPVYFCYPEYNVTDVVEDFNERHTFDDHLQVMFDKQAPPPEWDETGKYTFENLIVYSQDCTQDAFVRIPTHMTLKKVLSDRRTIVRDARPSFVVVSKETPYYQRLKTESKLIEF